MTIPRQPARRSETLFVADVNDPNSIHSAIAPGWLDALIRSSASCRGIEDFFGWRNFNFCDLILIEPLHREPPAPTKRRHTVPLSQQRPCRAFGRCRLSTTVSFTIDHSVSSKLVLHGDFPLPLSKSGPCVGEHQPQVAGESGFELDF